MMSLPTQVKIVEVGPRDGLQNEKIIIPPHIKIDFINRLSETGLSVIETTSFVSPKWIPQLADHAEVFTGIKKSDNISYPVLVPNLTGFHAAVAAGVKEVAVFTTPSEQFSQHNTHCSVNESLERIHAILTEAKKQYIKVRGYLSCVMGCPYEGDISPDHVAALARRLVDFGCYEVSLGDTIGVGSPDKTRMLIKKVSEKIDIDQVAVHFHDTYGLALINIYVALQEGVHIIDSAVSGLGGCPYAKGASGNVASEDVVYLLQQMGVATGIDLKKLNSVGRFITDYIKCESRSKVNQAFKLKA